MDYLVGRVRRMAYEAMASAYSTVPIGFVYEGLTFLDGESWRAFLGRDGVGAKVDEERGVLVCKERERKL